MQIAKTIAELRTARKLSQDDLAARLFVSRDLVSKWETGTRRPDWQMIERIAEVFDVSPAMIANKNELILKELSKCMPKNTSFSVHELTALLNAFLTNLSETEADIFVHRYYFLKNVAEIAVIYHIGKNHVRSILSRTRKKLKKYIEERENEIRKTI